MLIYRYLSIIFCKLNLTNTPKMLAVATLIVFLICLYKVYRESATTE